MAKFKIIRCINCNGTLGCLNVANKHISFCEDCREGKDNLCLQIKKKQKMENYTMLCNYCRGSKSKDFGERQQLWNKTD